MYRAIIVEDEMFVRIGLEHAINWSKYEMKVVGGAANGKEALQLYNEYNPHIIITDIKMPIMDGLELIETIRRRDKSIKFIILTCIEDFQMARTALENTVSFYFVKSDMNILEIEKAIEKIYLELIQYEDEKKISQIKEKENGYEVLHGYVVKEDESYKEVMLKKYNHDDENYVMVSVRIKNLEWKDKAKEQRQFTSLTEVMIEIIKKQKIGELVDISNNSFFILYRLKDDEEQVLILQLINHITYMVYSYFNLDTHVLIGEKFKQIIQIKNHYNQVLQDQYVYFYIEEKVVNLNDSETLQQIKDSIKQGISRIINYYRENFDVEYENEFFRYADVIDLYTTQDIQHFKKVIIQWIQLFMTIMHLTSESLIHYRSAVIEKVERAESFNEMIDAFIEAMKKSKEDLERQDSISIELVRVIQYIRENLNKRLTLPMVAKQANFSAGYLSYMFKQQLNTTFTDFVLKLRIQKAKIHLAQADFKLYQIAEKVGFQDPSYFNKVFKKATGITPMAYRNRCAIEANRSIEGADMSNEK